MITALAENPEFSPAEIEVSACSLTIKNLMIDDETIRLILESETIQVAAQALIAKANERGGDDNITAVISQVVA